MSKRKTFNIKCPSCGTQQDVELYEAVNVAVEPELKQALLENRLNRVGCTDCDASFRVDMPLLYSDPKHNVLIHWIPETETLTREQIIEDFTGPVTDQEQHADDCPDVPIDNLLRHADDLRVLRPCGGGLDVEEQRRQGEAKDNASRAQNVTEVRTDFLDHCRVMPKPKEGTYATCNRCPQFAVLPD